MEEFWNSAILFYLLIFIYFHGRGGGDHYINFLVLNNLSINYSFVREQVVEKGCSRLIMVFFPNFLISEVVCVYLLVNEPTDSLVAAAGRRLKINLLEFLRISLAFMCADIFYAVWQCV